MDDSSHLGASIRWRSHVPFGVEMRYALAYFLLASWVQGAEAKDPRQTVLAVARPLVGQVEEGNNAGRFVEEVLSSVGLGPGHPWCAAFNFFVFREAGFSSLVPKSAWSPDWLRGGERRRTGHPADVFGIYFPSRGRIAHTGIVEAQQGPWLTTIEGNTNEAGSRDGDGVYRKKRSVNSVVLKTYL